MFVSYERRGGEERRRSRSLFRVWVEREREEKGLSASIFSSFLMDPSTERTIGEEMKRPNRQGKKRTKPFSSE